MDTEALDLPEKSFDAVLCYWGPMILANLAGALGGIQRLLASGDRLAAAVWGEPQAVPMVSLPMGVMRQMVDVPALPPGAPGPFSLAHGDDLEQALRQVSPTPAVSTCYVSLIFRPPKHT